MDRGVRKAGRQQDKTTSTHNKPQNSTFYNQLQILRWTHEEHVKYCRCRECGEFAPFHIRTDRGNYFFLCFEHYKQR